MPAKFWMLVGAVLACTACRRAAEEASDPNTAGEIPEVLALALITSAAEESRIFVGAPPADLAAELPLPGGLPAVGGLTGDTGTRMVFQVTGSPESAFSALAEDLEGEGWERAPDAFGSRGGFQSSARPLRGTWCMETRWLQAASLSFMEARDLRIGHYEAELEPTPCESAWQMARISTHPFGLRIPDLEPPAGAEVEPSGGGGSTHETSMEARVVTRWSAEELFGHYAEQLQEYGWEGGAVTSSDGMALGRWSAETESGDPALGVLAVWPLPESDAYRAWIRMERVR